MRKFFGTFFREVANIRHHDGIRQALALNLRGEARKDGLKLKKALNRLEIEWRARDVHPWDRNVSPEEKGHLFVEQCLADTEAAILRLFEALPQVDILELRVVDPRSEATILAGAVNRSTMEDNDRLSVGMRLKLSGVNFRSSGWEFEALDTPDERESQKRARRGQQVPVPELA